MNRLAKDLKDVKVTLQLEPLSQTVTETGTELTFEIDFPDTPEACSEGRKSPLFATILVVVAPEYPFNPPVVVLDPDLPDFETGREFALPSRWSPQTRLADVLRVVLAGPSPEDRLRQMHNQSLELKVRKLTNLMQRLASCQDVAHLAQDARTCFASHAEKLVAWSVSRHSISPDCIQALREQLDGEEAKIISCLDSKALTVMERERTHIETELTKVERVRINAAHPLLPSTIDKLFSWSEFLQSHPVESQDLLLRINRILERGTEQFNPAKTNSGSGSAQTISQTPSANAPPPTKSVVPIKVETRSQPATAQPVEKLCPTVALGLEKGVERAAAVTSPAHPWTEQFVDPKELAEILNGVPSEAEPNLQWLQLRGVAELAARTGRRNLLLALTRHVFRQCAFPRLADWIRSKTPGGALGCLAAWRNFAIRGACAANDVDLLNALLRWSAEFRDCCDFMGIQVRQCMVFPDAIRACCATNNVECATAILNFLSESPRNQPSLRLNQEYLKRVVEWAAAGISEWSTQKDSAERILASYPTALRGTDASADPHQTKIALCAQ